MKLEGLEDPSQIRIHPLARLSFTNSREKWYEEALGRMCRVARLLHPPVGAARLLAIVALSLSLSLLLPSVSALAEGSPQGSGAAAAGSASVLSLDRLELTLAPEYDAAAPQVFGDIAGSLVNGSKDAVQQEVVIRLPKGGHLNSVCELSGDPRTTQNPRHDTLTSEQVRTEDKGDYVLVTWKMTKPVQPGALYPFHVEFYFPGIAGGPDKSLDYPFVSNYDATRLQVAVAEPSGAEKFETNLGAGEKSQGGDGLTYHVYSLPAVQAGTPVDVQVRYNRTSNQPSLTPQPQAAGQGSGAKGSEGDGAATKDSVALVVALLVLAGIGLVVYTSIRQPAGRKPVSGGRAVAAAAGSSAPSRPSDSGRTAPQGRHRAQGGGPPRAADPRVRARELLEAGKITEETYRILMSELDSEEGR